MGFNDIDIKVSGGSDIISTLQTYTTRILKPNIVDGKNVLTQEMLSSKNTKYVIKYVYELLGDTLTIPQNVILEFDGGSIKNGTLVGNDTLMLNTNETESVLDNVTLDGTWKESSYDFVEEVVADKAPGDGMGRIILRKDKTFAEQLTQENTIYVIRYDFELTEDVTIPANCVLQFEGGSISGNKITYNNTIVEGNYKRKILCECVGTNISPIVDCYMFGAIGDEVTDDTDALNHAVQCGAKSVHIPTGTYKTTGSIFIPDNVTVFGDGKSSHIKNAVYVGYNKAIVIIGYVTSDNRYPSQYSVDGYVCSIGTDKHSITLQTTSDAQYFNVGDIVVLTGNTIIDPSGTYTKYKYRAQFSSIITKIENGIITLEDGIFNPMFDGESEIKIRNFSTLHRSNQGGADDDIKFIQDANWCYSEDTCHVARFVTLKDICLESLYPTTGSNMYSIFLDGYKCTIDNVTVINGTTIFGCNYNAFCTIRDCYFEHSAGMGDFAELEICNKIENCLCIAKGTHINTQVPGLTFNNGFGNEVINCKFIGNNRTNYINFIYSPYSVLRGCFIAGYTKNDSSKCAVNGSVYGITTIEGCYIDCPQNGVYTQGGFVNLINCTILTKNGIPVNLTEGGNLNWNIKCCKFDTINPVIQYGNNVNGISSVSDFKKMDISVAQNETKQLISLAVGAVYNRHIDIECDISIGVFNLLISYGERSQTININNTETGTSLMSIKMYKVRTYGYVTKVYIAGKLVAASNWRNYIADADLDVKTLTVSASNSSADTVTFSRPRIEIIN